MIATLTALAAPLVPWLLLATGAVLALLGIKRKAVHDATKAEVQRAAVARQVDVVQAVTRRAAVDVGIGAASPAAVGDELRRQDRPGRDI